MLSACRSCGLVHEVAREDVERVCRCTRCGGVAHRPRRLAGDAVRWPLACSLGALLLYPLAMALPVLEIEKFGRTRASTIWAGVEQLASDGYLLIAAIVLVCSIVIPLGKIGGIVAVCAGERWLTHSHRAGLFRVIDFLGKWGMIDVMLVAFLVAAVKLGAWLDVHPGPGIVAFAAVVVLSMAASALFDPHAIWEDAA